MLAIEISYEIYQRGDFFKTLQLNQSQFEIAIDVKTNIIGHIFIQTKFCVKGWMGTKFCFI